MYQQEKSICSLESYGWGDQIIINLMEMSLNNYINRVHIDGDRGISNFIFLGQMLKKVFPHMKILSVSQNYSPYNATCRCPHELCIVCFAKDEFPDKIYHPLGAKHFNEFISLMNTCSEISFTDYQSSFWQEYKHVKEILPHIPPGCTLYLNLHYGSHIKINTDDEKNGQKCKRKTCEKREFIRDPHNPYNWAIEDQLVLEDSLEHKKLIYTIKPRNY